MPDAGHWRRSARVVSAIGAGALIGLMLLAALTVSPVDPAPSAALRFDRFIVLPRSGFLSPLDYLALARDHLYVTGLGNGALFDVDLAERGRATETSTMRSPDGGSAHAVVVLPDRERGFLTNGARNVVAVFDPRTLDVVKRIAVPADPDAALYDPTTRGLYVAGADSRTATLIDVDRLAIARTIMLPGQPEFAVLDAAAGRVYQNLHDRNAVAVVDLATRSLLATRTLPGCEAPTGLAIDGVARRLFVVCSGNDRLVVIDMDSFAPLASMRIGRLADSVGFDPVCHRIYVAGGLGEMTVIAQEPHDGYRVVDRIRTQPGAHTLTVDAATHAVFLAYSGIAWKPRIAVFAASGRSAVIE